MKAKDCSINFNRCFGGTTVIEKFWSRVDKGDEDECWEWMGAVSSSGYGSFQIRGRNWLPHRFSWIFHNGEVNSELFVCHHCDNKLCVNPKHLFIGTQRDNMLDMLDKGRGVVGMNFNQGEKHGTIEKTQVMGTS